MNYRHEFHAGNTADCLKHAILVWLLRALARKPAAFCVLDTHAGTGRYDLAGAAAQRTSEAASGILRLRADPPTALADYLGVVEQAGLYPGSPAIVASLLRPGDRAIACELHPEDHALLRRNLGAVRQLAIHRRDGYEAIGAFLPPAERRGLTLIDPPYEDPREFDRLLDALRIAHARFAGGVVMAWYPVKHRAPVRALHDALRASGIPDVLAAELLIRAPLDPTRLNGSGVVVINPPWRFEAEVTPLLAALLDRLGDREPGEAAQIIRLADE